MTEPWIFRKSFRPSNDLVWRIQVFLPICRWVIWARKGSTWPKSQLLKRWSQKSEAHQTDCRALNHMMYWTKQNKQKQKKQINNNLPQRYTSPIFFCTAIPMEEVEVAYLYKEDILGGSKEFRCLQLWNQRRGTGLMNNYNKPS